MCVRRECSARECSEVKLIKDFFNSMPNSENMTLVHKSNKAADWQQYKLDARLPVIFPEILDGLGLNLLIFSLTCGEVIKIDRSIPNNCLRQLWRKILECFPSKNDSRLDKDRHRHLGVE